jgi:hypothetical protein
MNGTFFIRTSQWPASLNFFVQRNAWANDGAFPLCNYLPRPVYNVTSRLRTSNVESIDRCHTRTPDHQLQPESHFLSAGIQPRLEDNMPYRSPPDLHPTFHDNINGPHLRSSSHSTCPKSKISAHKKSSHIAPTARAYCFGTKSPN